MKHHHLLVSLLVICIVTSAEAAEKPARLSRTETGWNAAGVGITRKASLMKYVFPDTMMVYSLVDTLRYLYTFDSIGLPARKNVTKWSAGAWADTSRETYSFTSSYSVTLIEKMWKGHWVDSARFSTAFYPSGNVSADTEEYFNNGRDSTRSVHAADDQGNTTLNEDDVYSGNLWTKVSRNVWTYDASGNCTSFLYESPWAAYPTLDLYEYDGHGNMLSDLTKQLMNSVWTDVVLDTCTYDSRNNKLLEYIGYSTVKGSLYPSSLTLYTYNDQGLLTYITEGGWNDTTMAWRFGGHVDTCIYNGNNRIGYYHGYESGGHMVYQWGDEYTYDSYGNVLTDRMEQWNGGVVLYEYLHTYTYNATSLRLTELLQLWSSGGWVNSNRYTGTYNGAGQRLTYLYEVWSNQQWSQSYQDTRTYNPRGEMLSDLYQSWTSGILNTQSWQVLMSYDTAGNMLTGSYTSWSGTAWQPADHLFGIILPAAYMTVQGYRITLHYPASTGTGVADGTGDVPVKTSLGQNYPNPFNPATEVSFVIGHSSLVSLRLYDVLGREVATLANEVMTAGEHSVQWNAAGMPSGVYFCRMTAVGTGKTGDKFSGVRKMLLLR
jgi:hypothetical protein